MDASKASDYIQMKIKMPNPSQEPPASSKAPNDDLKEMDVLCTFKIKIERWNQDHGCIKDQWPYPNQDQDAKPQSGTSSVLQSPKWGLQGHGCSLHLKIKIESWNLKHTFIKDQWPYPNQDQDVKPHLGTSSVLKRPKWELKGHWVSLHLQNQDIGSKSTTCEYQRPVTLSKSRSRSKTSVRNLQHPQNPRIWT